MSYWVYLNDDDGRPCEVDTHSEGGTYVVGGCGEAEINITYNYGGYIRTALDTELGLWWLNGKTGQETIARLQSAVDALGTERDSDYWSATPGNAGHALSVLLAWARQHPNGVWEVS